MLYESDFLPTPRVSISLAAGALVTGALSADSDGKPSEFTLPHGRRAMGPGPIASVGASFRVVDEKRVIPYVVISTSVAGLGTETRATNVDDTKKGGRGSYDAFDFRVGVTVGKTFANLVSPYLALRAFGGPVFFADQGKTSVGTDIYHVQPAVGLALILPAHLDAFLEAAPYFERGFNGGIGVRN